MSVAKEECRLCLSKDDLVWIFDKRIACPDNMKNVIQITTGVQICETDLVSQKVCSKCCQITIKMFKFRNTAQKNDLDLKRNCGQVLKEVKVTVKKDKREENREPKIVSKLPKNVHKSVKDLIVKYPKINLPTSCLSSHISPFIALKKSEVQNYFKSHTARKKTYSIKHSSSHPSSHQLTIVSKMVKENKKRTSSTEQNERQPKVIKLTTNNNLEVAEPSTSNEVSMPKDPVNNPVVNNNEVIFSLGLVPTSTTQKPAPESSSLLSYIEKSETIHLCDICNQVFTALKKMKSHRRNHLRCQFCKQFFHSFEKKNFHIAKNCIIKNMMNNSSYVQIYKLDFDVELRQKYPEAFRNLKPLQLVPPLTATGKADSPLVSTDVLCISDEEEVPTKKPVENSANPSNSTSLAGSTNPEKSTSVAISTNPPDLTNTPKPPNPPKPPNLPKLPNPTNPSNSTIPASVEAPTVALNVNDEIASSLVGDRVAGRYTTVSLVKPDVKINSSNIMFDSKCSDIKIIKDLLSLYKPVQTHAEKQIQTEMPTTKNIITNHKDKICEFKHLRHHLSFYKIPIIIKNGLFQVSYDYHTTRSKPPKKLHLWNQLSPLDIKSNCFINKSIANAVLKHKPNGATPVTKTAVLSKTSVQKPISPKVTTSYGVCYANTVVPSNNAQISQIYTIPQNLNASALPTNTVINSLLGLSYTNGVGILPQTTNTYTYTNPGNVQLSNNAVQRTTNTYTYGNAGNQLANNNVMLNNSIVNPGNVQLTTSNITRNVVLPQTTNTYTYGNPGNQLTPNNLTNNVVLPQTTNTYTYGNAGNQLATNNVVLNSSVIPNRQNLVNTNNLVLTPIPANIVQPSPVPQILNKPISRPQTGIRVKNVEELK